MKYFVISFVAVVVSTLIFQLTAKLLQWLDKRGDK
jgi:hypothetical protein